MTAPSKLRRTARSAALAVLLCTTAPAAFAQSVTTGGAPPVGISQEQFLALVGRLDALEARNRELEDQVLDLKGATAASDQAIRDQVSANVVTIPNGRPTISNADGSFTAAFRGVLQLDAAKFGQRRPGTLATDFRRGSLGDAAEADRARDLGDGLNFRRVRFGVEGKAFGDWSYNFLFDFGGSGVEEPGKITNAYIEYAGLKPLRFRVGAFAPTTGLEDATSNTASLFPERAAAAELTRSFAGGDGRTGAAVLANGERWSAFGAVTGNTIAVSSFDEQLGAVLRATYAPIKTPDTVVHIGGAANIVINPAATGPDVAPAGAATPIRLRERPELRVDPTRLVDTGSIDADGLTSLGLEAAVQHKNFSLQGEKFWFDLERRNSALADPSFGGWYVQGAWTLTGEPRRYNVATGGFDSPRVEKPFKLGGDLGVWELAARYSVLDLDYQAGVGGAAAPSASSVRGGEQTIWTLGLNWYPNANVRFLADYQRVDVDRLSPGGTAFGAGALTPPAGAQVGQTFDVWSFRTQYAF